MTVYTQPGQPGGAASYLPRYDNWIGGKRVPPVKGKYFDNPTPVTGQTFCEIARRAAEDIELALDPAHRAAPAWGRMSITARANILNLLVSCSPKALGFF
jgi:aldehyde dehydrogenase